MSVIEEPVKTSVVDDCAVLRFAALGSHALSARRGGRRRIVAPDGSQIVPISKPQPDGALVKALARAWRWQRLLDKGIYADVSEIGDAERINKGYVSRVLRLALLAPDVVEPILAGRTDQALMLEGLARSLPASREEQRNRLRLSTGRGVPCRDTSSALGATTAALGPPGEFRLLAERRRA